MHFIIVISSFGFSLNVRQRLRLHSKNKWGNHLVFRHLCLLHFASSLLTISNGTCAIEYDDCPPFLIIKSVKRIAAANGEWRDALVNLQIAGWLYSNFSCSTIAVAIAARYKINHLPIVIISITYLCCACNMLQVESYNGLCQFISNGGNDSNEIITEIISNL